MSRGTLVKKATKKPPARRRYGQRQASDKLIIENYKNAEKWKWRILIGMPSLGQVRMEWATAFASVVVPMNFSTSRVVVPIGMVNPQSYHVAEAQNLVVRSVITAEHNWEYVLFVEDDVVVSTNLFVRLSKWIRHGIYPIVSGLYHLKTEPPEPMTFRGRGSGAYTGWYKGPGQAERRADLPEEVKPREVVLCDAVPTGCLLISKKLLQVAWNESREIELTRVMSDGSVYKLKCREVFQTIREAGQDPETGAYFSRMGTSDMEFCDRVMRNDWMKKAGFKKAAKMKYPFPVDLEINCGHISLETGKVY